MASPGCAWRAWPAARWRREDAAPGMQRSFTRVFSNLRNLIIEVQKLCPAGTLKVPACGPRGPGVRSCYQLWPPEGDRARRAARHARVVGGGRSAGARSEGGAVSGGLEAAADSAWPEWPLPSLQCTVLRTHSPAAMRPTPWAPPLSLSCGVATVGQDRGRPGSQTGAGWAPGGSAG